MQATIKTLTCRVTVSTGRKLQQRQDDQPSKPTMHFLLPVFEPKTETREDTASKLDKSGPDAARADADRVENKPTSVSSQAVADRVYELMLEEVRLGR